MVFGEKAKALNGGAGRGIAIFAVTADAPAAIRTRKRPGMMPLFAVTADAPASIKTRKRPAAMLWQIEEPAAASARAARSRAGHDARPPFQ